MASEERLLRILKTVKDNLERHDSDGFMDCPHCSASGWAFIEHDEDCVVLEIRAILGLCRHGYTGGYNHGQGSCPALREPRRL